MDDKLFQIQKVLGKRDAQDRWNSITYAKTQKLLKLGLLPLLLENDRGSTHQMIRALLKKHTDLRATGILMSNGGVALDGFDAHGHPMFKPETIRDFFEFAWLYSDDFSVSPQHLFMWFD